MSLDLDAALGSYSDALPTPSWDEMVEAAEAVTSTSPVTTNTAPSGSGPKHLRGGGFAPRGRGGPQRGRGKRGGKEKGTVGRWSGTAPTGGPSWKEVGEGKSLSATIAEAIPEEGEEAPSVNQPLEDEVDRLSVANTQNEERLGQVEEELLDAKKTIRDLQQDQQDIMSEFSALRKEMITLRAMMKKGNLNPGKPDGDRPTKATVHAGREIIIGAPSSSHPTKDPVVASGPSWRRDLGF
jgi:hypothetical protein